MSLFAAIHLIKEVNFNDSTVTVVDLDRQTQTTDVGQLFENIKCKSSFTIRGIKYLYMLVFFESCLRLSFFIYPVYHLSYDFRDP